MSNSIFSRWSPHQRPLSNYRLSFRNSKTSPASTELSVQTQSQQPERSVETTNLETTERSLNPSTLQAWLQVIVNFLVMMNSFGLIQSFGIFQLPYEISLKSAPSTVAWIGSVHIFFVYFLGTFSGWALDHGWYKRLLVLGSIFQIVGLIAAGYSDSFVKAFFFHGVFQGIGHGLMFCPAVTMTAVFFEGSRSKMTALGIAGCGASFGGIIFPLIARYTIITKGISFTMWIMCCVVSFTSILIVLLARTGPSRKYSAASDDSRTSKKRIVDWHAFKEPTYALYVIAMFFVFVGLWIPFFYIREFSADALHVSKSESFIMLIILNAAGIPGRIVPALFADLLIGTLNMYIITLLLTSAILLFWPLVSTEVGMFGWTAAYGFGAAGVSSLLQAGLTSINDEPTKTGQKIGMAFTVVGFASLVGGPIGGELIRIGEETRVAGPEAYVWMIVFTGVIMFAGAVTLCVARLKRTGYRFLIKV
ncbi:hypothetical protein HBI16_227620 [Parastagonospora nodorum]|nr:hypothetical protein HBI71_164980 [Parastagonospora nodorum]KAH5708652.1 hypothetical protein HBI20_195080 [Parastagonospora nodorum]KAH5754311.1 hypothetical protein HBI16_227620 [Parastagonospora nodorum]